MANPKQLELLKAGVEGWNKWRSEQPNVLIDLSDADMSGTNLSNADLSGANLSGINLRGANLVGAHLIVANLVRANLFGAKLIGSNLVGANLSTTDLIEVDLSASDLKTANLRDANLRGANLSATNLDEVNLSGASLKGAQIGGAILGNNDLSTTNDLETVHHGFPSTIGTNTIQRSKGKIPEVFLRGCGLSDILIETQKLFNPDLTNDEIVKIQYHIYDLRATQALQISPLFISYSHADTVFVNQIDSALITKGIRFWRDIHNATAGRLETQIDRAIRQNPTVLLVLSKNSLNSDWVQYEVRKARELEKEFGRDTLCPIALDDSWKSGDWTKRIMEQIMEYNILDFSGWEDETAFESKFAKLLNGLDLFYKKTTT